MVRMVGLAARCRGELAVLVAVVIVLAHSSSPSIL